MSAMVEDSTRKARKSAAVEPPPFTKGKENRVGAPLFGEPKELPRGPRWPFAAARGANLPADKDAHDWRAWKEMARTKKPETTWPRGDLKPTRKAMDEKLAADRVDEPVAEPAPDACGEEFSENESEKSESEGIAKVRAYYETKLRKQKACYETKLRKKIMGNVNAKKLAGLSDKVQLIKVKLKKTYEQEIAGLDQEIAVLRDENESLRDEVEALRAPPESAVPEPEGPGEAAQEE